MPCVVLSSTTPEEVLIRIGCACNAAHDSAVKYTFGEKLRFAVQVALQMNISRADVVNQAGTIPKLARKLDVYYNSGQGLDKQIQNLKNMCNALFLPDKAVDLIIAIDQADATSDPSLGRQTRLFTRDIIVKADGPWYWLAEIDDELCVKLAEDVQGVPFRQGEKSKLWRERVYLKHIWRGFLVKNLLDALETAPAKAARGRRTKSQARATSGQGKISLVELVSEGKFDLPLDVLKVDGLAGKEDGVNRFLDEAVKLGLFDDHCDLSRMSYKVNFTEWISKVARKDWDLVWQQKKVVAFALPTTGGAEEEQATVAKEAPAAEGATRTVDNSDTEYFKHPWNVTPEHYGVFDTLDSFKGRVKLVHGGVFRGFVSQHIMLFLTRVFLNIICRF